jgi:cobalt/nickel transport system permease protein
MHIPDGFIPLWQCAIYIILTFIAWIFTLKWLAKSLIKFEKEKPSFGKIISYLILIAILLPSFVFIIQSVNIPIPWGVGISLLGSALVSIILRSPWGAVLIMSPVLIVQGLFFGDGGLTAIGANIINIAVVGGFSGFYIYKLAKPMGRVPRAIIGGWFAGFASLVLVAEAVAVEMWLSGTFPLAEGIISGTMYSAVAGILEGILTMIGCILILFINSKPREVETHEKKNLVDTKKC